jgi:hypothetical protein
MAQAFEGLDIIGIGQGGHFGITAEVVKSQVHDQVCFFKDKIDTFGLLFPVGLEHFTACADEKGAEVEVTRLVTVFGIDDISGYFRHILYPYLLCKKKGCPGQRQPS